MATLLWLQTGACGGDSLAILSAESPSLEQLLQDGGVDLLWHPSLSHGHARRFDQLVDAVLAGEQVLDILCVEGSIITAPRGTGLCDPYRGRGKMDLVRDLAERAGVVVAMGTCAAFGACMRRRPTPRTASACSSTMPSRRPAGAGLALAPGPAGRQRGGLPGPPAHHDPDPGRAGPGPAAAAGRAEPARFALQHRGAPGLHPQRIPRVRHRGHAAGRPRLPVLQPGLPGADDPGGVQCRPVERRQQQDPAGVPCFGCTSPTFPRDGDLFRTEKMGEVPIRLPLGVERPRYMAYKNLARAAAPQRVRDKKMKP
jgi:hydrogenase small subunit